MVEKKDKLKHMLVVLLFNGGLAFACFVVLALAWMPRSHSSSTTVGTMVSLTGTIATFLLLGALVWSVVDNIHLVQTWQEQLRVFSLIVGMVVGIGTASWLYDRATYQQTLLRAAQQ